MVVLFFDDFLLYSFHFIHILHVFVHLVTELTSSRRTARARELRAAMVDGLRIVMLTGVAISILEPLPNQLNKRSYPPKISNPRTDIKDHFHGGRIRAPARIPFDHTSVILQTWAHLPDSRDGQVCDLTARPPRCVELLLENHFTSDFTRMGSAAHGEAPRHRRLHTRGAFNDICSLGFRQYRHTPIQSAPNAQRSLR